ncbi:gamma-glutamyl-gamma-aminobutyrate hydrolase family protein [Sinomicrobium weinanense]|uniref:Gamma-glutamyl-gamma-aminobutyrate hydrolase family protein n=1 Tax=Sinomicrobium weinanense TaxID=2842200 RepID=A0A926Q380_9FLAO|nr:gamma-glutamyl-gamma-aminobutyrate hydrolase family protein [Sinomicrobium weinanense]MBC9797347.1 gamma-glutamyl-gamma-aminobutyrate hydrolase family protein [Sinomicrobium weinanense]MBU3124527.1 gamma-glutamyl-gamma-aminobutyrate hydrolase family protein [Sinomicrobium weinanense]
MIRIGITSCFMYPDKERNVFGPKSLNYLENDMVRYVTRKGVLPVLLPDVDDLYLNNILSEMDGFVLQGGTDIAPETYGEKPIGKWKGDAYRDRYELKILDFAIKNSKPVLGICRGFQLMNVYFGGSLYQDTSTQNPEIGPHRSADLYDTVRHPINFVEDTYLANLYKDETDPYVNTVHHQAVKELGKDLEVYALSADGLIEAFGYTGEPAGKVVGVQWHPEFFHTIKEELIDADKLYEAFLQHTK